MKPSRKIPEKAALILYVQAGGRCEFDGCNRYLLEHYPTEAVGNFAQRAHIYAFSQDGPRGAEAGRPLDINDPSNLMLLCQQCHHLIDTERPEEYPAEILKRYKRTHEDRIHDLTDLSEDRDTVPLVLRGLVRGRPVDVVDETMRVKLGTATYF